MKKQIRSVYYLIIAHCFICALFTGCVVVNFGNDMNGGGSVQAVGERENYKVSTGPFSKIKVEGNCDVRYHNGNSDTVTLLVQPNVREHIIIETVNGELIFRTTKKISYGLNKGPVLTVYAPVINQVKIEGAGAFTANDKITGDSLSLIISGAGSGKAELEVNSLSTVISGAGSIDLSGRANNSVITMSGAGSYNALSLVTNDATIDMSGAGSIKLNCTGTLRINADGAGSVEYRGSPSLNLNTSGLIGIKNLN